MKRSRKVRREVILALGLAVISGTIAAVGVNGWMTDEFARIMSQQVPAAPSVKMTTVVVAKEDLGLGTPMTRDKLLEAPWPASNVPSGSYRTIAQFLGGTTQVRVALTPIAENEPVLRSKASGNGERFGLSTMLEHNKMAVAIRVNDVLGVGGFVLPGDRVDILVTRDVREGADRPDPYTDVLIQNVRVLAVDQTFDPKHAKPTVGRTVTVEVGRREAQRVTLAAAIGTLSLALRENGAPIDAENWKRVTLADLSWDNGDKPERATLIPTNSVAPEPADVAPSLPAGNDGLARVIVVRATKSTEYSVFRRLLGE